MCQETALAQRLIAFLVAVNTSDKDLCLMSFSPGMTKDRSDRFLRVYGPLLEMLKEMGGEGPAGEVMRKVADQVFGDSPERARVLKSGGNAAENEVAWARNNLKEAGLIDASTRGVWRLTERGWETRIDSIEDAWRIGNFRDIKLRAGVDEDEAASEDLPAPEGAGPTLLEVLRLLSPQGFERLCQLVLRRAGFEEVEVTGRSGDGGIDGHGLLQVNELVTFQVLFQCKRYQGTVGPGEIRNFRGAMSGRTDKGIFLTTGSFTNEATKEARREGVPPIELVDGEKLRALMERLQIGVRPRTIYDVDLQFFENYGWDQENYLGSRPEL